MVIVSLLTNQVVTDPFQIAFSSWRFWIGGRSWPLTSLDPKTMKNEGFWTPNIWVIGYNPKNEGNVGSHGSSWDDPQYVHIHPAIHPFATSCATPGADCLAATAAACANFAAWAATSVFHVRKYLFKCCRYIPGSSKYVKLVPFGRIFGWKGTNFTHLEDPGICWMYNQYYIKHVYKYL